MDRLRIWEPFIILYAFKSRRGDIYRCDHAGEQQKQEGALKPYKYHSYFNAIFMVWGEDFSPQRTQSMNAFYDIYLRRLVISHLRKSADRSKKCPALLLLHGFPAPSPHTFPCPPCAKVPAARRRIALIIFAWRWHKPQPPPLDSRRGLDVAKNEWDISPELFIPF